jgi:hypothetical protein
MKQNQRFDVDALQFTEVEVALEKITTTLKASGHEFIEPYITVTFMVKHIDEEEARGVLDALDKHGLCVALV